MRPTTLFTGQWADLPIAELLPKVKEMGYDGVELACWGDHFDVDQALNDDSYVSDKWALLQENGLNCYSISNHLVGQAICDNIDERHKAIIPDDVWGEGDPEKVRRRAEEHMIKAGQACRKFMDAKPEAMRDIDFAPAVNGFTGSSIWHALYSFPPTSQEYLQAGFDDFGTRFTRILDAFEKVDMNFGLEVHPTEIAFDIVSAERAIEAVNGHKRFGFNYDPSHFAYQGVDYVKFIRQFSERIFHVHMKDVWFGHGDGTVGVFGGHTEFADPRRHWDFRSVGRGDVNFEEIIVALNDIEYAGPLSVEWEDARMERFHGAKESCAYVKALDFPTNHNGLFDSAFDSDNQ
ncbi:MAG: sugar phosphate isomerase/epimerase [Rubritalea sp.]|jgi:sugar phosphate isomerase/epimerase